MMMGGGWLIGLLVLLLFVLLIGGAGVAILWFARDGSARGSGTMYQARREEDALEILRRRYARGEITREEFERMREEVRS